MPTSPEVGPSSQHARRCAAAVALVVFAAVAIAGLATRHDPPPAVSADRALQIGARVPGFGDVVRTATAHQVLAVDDRLVKVVWLRHGRILAEVGVRDDGRTYLPVRNSHARAGYGAPLSHLPVVLAGLSVLFLLATLRGPLRRRRTLDVLALALLVVPAVLIDRGWLGAGEGVAAALLGYLAVRGVLLAVRGPARAGDDPGAPVLLERLAARLGAPRLPQQVAIALAGASLLVILTSTGIVDVALANMEGATLLLHGTLPYGHMPGDVIHGDTYGLPIYAIYAPLAALWPMASDWDEATGALVVGAVAVVAALLGARRAAGAGAGAPWPAIIATLAFPAALMSTSSGTNDVLIAVAVIWAFAWFARPAASSALLMLAGMAKVAPLILLPLWLARLRGAALLRAMAACAAVGGAVLVALVALGGLHGPLDMVDAMSFQLSRRSPMSIWTSLGLQPLQPLAQAAAAALALGAATLVLLDRSVAADPQRVAGLVCATLAVLQLAANHWMPLYLLWLAPPAMAALLGPLGARAATAAVLAPSPAATPRFASA
ncbi:MAG: hypothetical protein QOF86_1504 [Baekduia sp.]|nr:hypothetical protein [Baekduia sp.]